MEMVVIAIIALIVLGPNKLPEAAKSLGKGFREMRDSFQGAVEGDDDDKDDDGLSFDHDEDEDAGDLDMSDAVAEQDDKVAPTGSAPQPAEESVETHQKDAESSVPSASSSSTERE